MSLTMSFKESEVPAWIKERLRTWHTQLFTDLDHVDFYSPSCRQDILKRFDRSFPAFASYCVRRYRKLPALAALARVVGCVEETPLDFALFYLAFKRLYPEFESYYESRFQDLLPNLTSDPVASFLLGLTETIPAEFAKGFRRRFLFALRLPMPFGCPKANGTLRDAQFGRWLLLCVTIRGLVRILSRPSRKSGMPCKCFILARIGRKGP